MTGNAAKIELWLSVQKKENPDALYDIEPHREKRSLDANAMLWACMQEIAQAIQTDKWSVYLQMLKRYGKFSYVIVRPEAVEAMKKQWRELEVVGEVDVNGQKGVQLLCYYGSSTYNTKEFSVLLDGVISEMREMGLEPPPDKETKALIEAMERKEKRNEINHPDNE